MAIRDLTYVGEGLIPAPQHGNALRYTRLPKGNVTDIAIHHMTGFLPPVTWTADEEIAYLRRIDQYHRTGRGLDGIGYHTCPFPSGRAYVTSRLDRYGAGVGGHNDHTLHIALPGTFNLKTPSPAHLAAAVEAVKHVYDYLGREVPTRPHLYWPASGTSCPGGRWREWVPQLRTAAEEDDMKRLTVIQGSSPVQYVTDWMYKWGLPSLAVRNELTRLGRLEPGVTRVSNELLKRLKATRGFF